jgi:hypothetical protein
MGRDAYFFSAGKIRRIVPVQTSITPVSGAGPIMFPTDVSAGLPYCFRQSGLVRRPDFSPFLKSLRSLAFFSVEIA